MSEPKPISELMEQMLASIVEQAAERLLQRLQPALQQQPAGAGADEGEPYVEPGPGSPRQFFTAAELAGRWGWGKTKVYELIEEELPVWRHGQQVRYFWAYVWSFEGRISREEADRIWNDYGTVQASKLKLLPHSAEHPARLRKAGAD